MKNTKRWIALLLALLMCLSLCGCDELDAMRNAHAVWQEDGSILWNGNVYRKLENTSSMSEFGFSYDYVTIYVTQPDVPVLLSGWFGEGMDVCADGMVLECYDYRLVEDGRMLFCREDMYDDIAEKMAGGTEMTTFFYDYYDYEKENSVKYYLSEEQGNAIRRVLSTVIPIPWEDFDANVMDSLGLSMCDDSHLFEEDSVLWLGMSESSYYIEENEYVYIVPESYNEIFDAIWKAYNDGVYVMSTPPTIVV